MKLSRRTILSARDGSGRGGLCSVGRCEQECWWCWRSPWRCGAGSTCGCAAPSIQTIAGIHKTDFTVYTEAGAAFFDGRPPYEVTNPRGWGYLYPPPFAMLVAPLHALPPRGQVLVWFAISALMVYGCYSECVRIARAILPADEERGLFGPIPNWIGICAVVAALLPALNCLQRGQVGVAKLYLLLLGFRLCVAGPSRLRSLLGGIVLALPIALKVTPLLPVGVLLLQQGLAAWHGQARRTELARAAASASGVGLGLAFSLLLLPAALIGWRANLEHLDTWWHAVALQAEESMDDSFAGDSSSPRNQSFSNAVQLLGNWGDYYFAGGPLDKDPMPRRRHGQQFLMDARVVHFALLLTRALRWAACCWPRRFAWPARATAWHWQPLSVWRALPRCWLRPSARPLLRAAAAGRAVHQRRGCGTKATHGLPCGRQSRLPR